MNYLFGNCVIDDNTDICSVVPFTYETELVKNTGYLKDGYVYIYRGDIAKQKKYKNGLFTDTKGNLIFALTEENRDKFTFENLNDDSIHSIVKQAKKINPKLKTKIMKEINKSSDIYMPEFDANDDFLKHLVKLMVTDKKIDLKEHRLKFKKNYDMTNIKAALENKTSADGKRGSLTINNLIKWMEVLEMDIEVSFRDNPRSEDPCFKVYKYSGENGYQVIDESGDVNVDEDDDDFEDYDDEEIIEESE